MDLLLLLTSILVLETTYLVFKQTNHTPAKTSLPKILLDTSVLIDGRIEPIVRSGFVSAEIIVPRSVVRELQFMADKADHEKRERARYGLDRIQVLQSLDESVVTILDDGETHHDGVDEQLIVLSKRLSARLCTVDYNLNKVARVEGVSVVNINELAHALRPAHLPGERISVEIVQKGQVKEQGVGYLDDGTMVVVDNAKKYLGNVLEVEAIRMLQTEAGRMLFAKPVFNDQPEPKTHTQPKRHNRRKVSPEDKLIESANRSGRN